MKIHIGFTLEQETESKSLIQIKPRFIAYEKRFISFDFEEKFEHYTRAK